MLQFPLDNCNVRCSLSSIGRWLKMRGTALENDFRMRMNGEMLKNRKVIQNFTQLQRTMTFPLFCIADLIT